MSGFCRAAMLGMALKRGGWLLLAGLLALPGGCGDPSAEEAGGTRVLRITNWTGPGNDPKFLSLERELREDFVAAYQAQTGDATEIVCRLEQIPGDGNYMPKLLMRHVAGQVPDVMHLDASSAAVFIENDVLLDLRPYIEGDPTFSLEMYFENVVDFSRRGEAIYGIPLDFTPMVMFYNKDLFDEAGVPYPEAGWTWEAFLETAQALTKVDPETGRVEQYGMYFFNIMPFWVMWLWNNGGDVLDGETHEARGTLDGPRSVAAVQFLVDLIEKYDVAPDLDEAAAAGVDLFRAGKAAMDVKGHWMVVDYRAAQLNFGIVSLPRNVPERSTVAYASSLAIMANAENPELAWAYIKFMTSAATQIKRLQTGLAISGNKRAAAHFAGNEIEDAFLAEVPYARPPWGAYVEGYAVVEDLGREMMEDILYSDGAIPVEAACRRTAILIDKELSN